MSEDIIVHQVSKPNKRYFVFASDCTELASGIDELLFSFNTRKGMENFIKNFTDRNYYDYWQILDSRTGYAVKCYYCGTGRLLDMLTVLENVDTS